MSLKLRIVRSGSNDFFGRFRTWEEKESERWFLFWRIFFYLSCEWRDVQGCVSLLGGGVDFRASLQKLADNLDMALLGRQVERVQSILKKKEEKKLWTESIELNPTFSREVDEEKNVAT